MTYSSGVTREQYDRSYSAGLEVPPDRHPSTHHFARMFATGHLQNNPDAEVAFNTSRQFAALAQWCVDHLADGQELPEALRHLWEAKNNAVVHVAQFGQ